MLPTALKLRWRRKRLLWRSFRSRHALKPLADRTDTCPPEGPIAFVTVRNEAQRLPYFLQYHKNLGVQHFLVVENASTDNTVDLLLDDPSVSLWTTKASYRASRFGVDWLTWLQMRYGAGRWCLTLDADELLVYAGSDRHSLMDLTDVLERQNRNAFGALMLDLFPDGPLDSGSYAPGDDPTKLLGLFDPGPYRAERQMPLQNLWVQGGVRERVFFADAPRRSPTLNKLPFVKWDRRFAYVNSCHSMLPPKINLAYDGPAGTTPGGVLLHTKFLPGSADRAREEKSRRQHFNKPESFDDYYDRIQAKPVLRDDHSLPYLGPKSLVDAGLMPDIDWP